ncbi:PQQ-binding-like beta-propeller repeat protein [Streptomyces sp. NPDC056938]|uniref:serine/threonine-protein kinase n=1 Tax=Streptomyces sp. NPDC056938 TaxID=3345970 RepID=UPI00362AA831
MERLSRELRPGDPGVLGPWRLLGVLGEGGMGSVYLGRSGRRVAAVKTLKAEFLDEVHFVVRFRREHRAAEAVRTPYVPKLLGADLTSRPPWIATEFVAAPTVERCVEESGPLPETSTALLGALLASALAGLHAAGVVHRDLKPSNVLLAADGPRIVDFGIARLPAATVLTMTGQRPGSAGYMSPEQVGGAPPGPPSDVFTLGALLAYASSGHHAFGEHGLALADYAIAHEEPDLTHVPPALAPDLRRCLAKDPAARPTAEQLAVRWRAPRKRPEASWLPAYVTRHIFELNSAAQELAGLGPSRRRVLAGAGGVLLAGSGGGVWWAVGREAGPRGVPRWNGKPGETPKPVWSVADLGSPAPFAPARANDVLLVADRGKVSALDPRTGERLWSKQATAAPVPQAARALLIGRDGTIRAFDSRTGEASWEGPGGLARLLAVDADSCFAADRAGRVVAVRLRDGSVLWRSDDAVAPGRAAGVASGGTLLLTPAKGKILALNSATGEWRWAASGTGAGGGGGHAVLGGAVLRGLDLDSGKERWRARTIGDLYSFGTPVVHRGLVYVTEGDLLRCLKVSDGSGVREVSSAGGLYATTPPVIAGGGLYVPLAEGANGIAALPLDGDAERYRFSPTAAGDGAWSITATDDVVAVANGGRLYSLPLF